MADCTFTAETQSVIPKSKKSISFRLAANAFMMSAYKIEDAWDIKKFNQNGERQAEFILNIIRSFQTHAGISTVNQAKFVHMKKYLDSRALQVRESTVNRYVQALKRFFEFCEDMEYIVKSNARKLKKIKVKDSYRYQFNTDEITSILKNAGCFKDYYTIGLETGLRPCDMWNLNQSDFKDIDGVKYFKIFSEKTGTFMYTPLTASAADIVDNADEKLFPNANEEFWRKGLRCNLKANFSAAYIRKWNIRLHTLRHTFADRCLAAGISKESIQNLMGHASVKTTEIYCNQRPKEKLAEELLKLPTLPQV